ncbi:MAG: trypsin-like peptidase domain-containing protein [Eubacteriales bacterium]|nr:trypsin-like peptidase domain-containing protein [Eubacteriales bacterium]
MKKALAVIVSALVFGAVAGATILGITHAAGVQTQIEAVSEAENETQAASEKETKAVSETNAAEEKTTTKENKQSDNKYSAAVLDVSDLAEESMPQLVSITNTMVVRQYGYSNIFDYFYGGGMAQEYEVPASGSGVILDKTDDELLIVTNNHVIEDSKELSVTFIDGTTVDAAVKGADSSIDIAVIAIPLSEISDETMSAIKIATLHDQEDLKVGQGVIAIGNALGYGQSVTVGYISALGREIEAENTVYSDLIQVDAAINPGNSGGALINMKGELIGINVAKLSETSVEGIGYSIPIYKVKEVIDDLSNAKTKVEVAEENQGRLGIYMNTVSQANAQALGIPAGVIIRGFSDELADGYTEADVQESPAKEAGLLKNDIITKFDNQKVTSADELARLVKYYEAGSTVDVTVQRLEDGTYAEKVIQVTLGSKKNAAAAAESQPDEKNKGGKSDAADAQNAENGDNAGNAESSADSNDSGNSTDSANGDNSAGSDSSADGGNANASEDQAMYDLFRQFLEQYR